VLATTPGMLRDDEKLVTLPTGDGMALSPTARKNRPACLEIAEALQKHRNSPHGIHSGPVSEVTDVRDAPTSPGPASTWRNE
jgi:hypothetical protein